MSEQQKQSWFRTGAIAKELGTSSHKIRALARAGLIESELRNGYRYVPERELERLRDEGLPPMPASIDVEDSLHGEQQQAGGTERPDVRSPARSRLAQELYAEPSRQLAKSKEKVIRLQHSVEAKRLIRESREMDKAVKEEQARAREAQRVQDWRDGHVRRAVERVPAEVCADVCARIEDLLNRVPACANVTAKVDELIEAALRPIRRREEQDRALAAHCKRIADAARRINLPYGAASDEQEEARELAVVALTQTPVGGSDRQFRRALEDAILPIVERINHRQAEQERRRQEAGHKSRIDSIVSWLPLGMPSGATSAETEDAKRVVRAALSELPATASGTDLDAAKDKVLAPIEAVIRQRNEAQRRAADAAFEVRWRCREAEARAESLLSSVETRLGELEEDGAVTFEGYFDKCDLRDRTKMKIRPILIQEIAENPALSDTHFRERIADLVDEHHVEFCH